MTEQQAGGSSRKNVDDAATPSISIINFPFLIFSGVLFLLAYASGSVLWDAIVNGEVCGRYSQWSTSVRCLNWETGREMIFLLLPIVPVFVGASLLGLGIVFLAVTEFSKARRKS